VTVLRSGSATDVGRVRNANQDRSFEGPNLFAVADGMGGHVGGEVAARVAVESLQSAFARAPSVSGLREAVEEANAAVFRRSQEEDGLRGMGTTLTAAALVAQDDGRDVIALANVGDSRAYVFSDGIFSQVTADHSLAEEKVRHGELTEAQAAVHPHRHILTRALGVSPDVDVDLWELHLKAGDRILLCSDGLSNEVRDDEIAGILARESEPGDASRALVRIANDHGGNDNITVVVVDVVLGDDGQATTVVPVGLAGAPLVLTGALDPGPGPGDPSPDVADPGPDVADPGPGTGAGGPPTAVIPSVAPLPTGDGSAGGGSEGSADDVTGMVGAQPGGSAGGSGDLAATAMVPAVAAGAATGVATAVSDDFFMTTRSLPAGTSEDYPPWRPSEPAAKSGRQRRAEAGIPRLITFRVVLFTLLVAAVVVGAYVFVRWYATDNWYVTVNGQQLVVYQGRPGGLLWFRPKLVDQTGVTTSQVLAVHLPALQGDVNEPSLGDARHYVVLLHQEFVSQQQVAQGGAPNASGTGPNGALPTIPPPVVAPPTTAGAPATTAPAGSTTTTRPPVATTTSTVPPTTTTSRPPVTTTTATTTPSTTATRSGAPPRGG